MMRRTYEKEAHVKQDVIEILKELGILYHMPSASGFGRVGVSDFVCCAYGRYLEIETKFGRNKQTEMQLAWMAKVQKHKGTYMVVDEHSIQYLKAALESYAST